MLKNKNDEHVKKIALIDADSLVYYCALGNKENPVTLEDAQIDLDNRISTMTDGCDSYILFMTNRHITFRNKIATIRKYKGNRKKTIMPPVFAGLKRYLLNKGVVEGAFNLEADDLVAFYKYYFEKQNIETIICSPDKDVLQQIPGIHYNYGKQIVIETTEEEAYKFLFIQTIMGDTIDGIPGIAGYGLKKAKKYLEKVEPKDYHNKALELYCENYGIVTGICNFTETFRLVYMLRTEDDLLREGDVPNIENPFEIDQDCILPTKVSW